MKMVETTDTPARILIVDDEPQIRGMLHKLLGEVHECVEAASAEESLELLRGERFDLILTDIIMGGMSGLEMLSQARQLAPETVVIMISAEQTIDNAIEAMRAGAFDYVTKPFDLRQVGMAIRRALDYLSLREAKRRYEADLEELVKRRTAQLDHATFHDDVTDLPNRKLFEERLAQALTRARATGARLAVMYLDLDRFKNVNDTLGYVAGDRFLRDVSERLRSCLREDDAVARTGSDEFALLLTHVGGTEEVIEVTGKVHDALKPAFHLDSHELYVTTSIGISLYPDDGCETMELLRNAGAALYRAKGQGGNSYQFYEAEMNARAVKRLALESSLRRALGSEEILLYYQPQVDQSGRIVGAEALVRWQHPELGLLSPAEFIPLAEETGLIVPLGVQILRAACTEASAWKVAGHPLLVSVNFSPRQFCQPDLVMVVARLLRETGLEPNYLEVELTESSVMKNAESAIVKLNELKELGVNIAIDDFGTGYSSLSYLKRLPIDTLKIDQSFVRDVTTDPKDAAIVRAIITLAHSLDLKVKAEGVERKEQLRFLRLLRCDVVQGYLLGRPTSAEAFGRLLQENESIVSLSSNSSRA
jgi:diguanylate cyclase (GGDEF)-like protein